MNILESLAQETRQRIEKEKERVSFAQMMEMAFALPAKDFAFEKALAKPGLRFICECKHASPSRGVIEPDYDPVAHAIDYEKAGADCISVLTEPGRFLGSDEHLKAIAQAVSIPILRKDFTIDPYMIAQARVFGADAVLLIASLLDEPTMRSMIELCDQLGLSALCEAHTPEQIEQCMCAGARIIGVNNRDLRDFSISMDNAQRLRGQVGANILFVCESGIRSARDIESARRMAADAVLIGETMMKADNKTQMLRSLKGLPARRPSVKLCGMKSPKDIRAAKEAGADAVGFVFCPGSPRSVDDAALLEAMFKEAGETLLKVGVFKNMPVETICTLADRFDALQLHGYTEEDIRHLQRQSGKPVIAAFAPENSLDLEAASHSAADLVLLDGKQPGSGKAFDWSRIPQDFRDFMLAGGLNTDNISRALSQTDALIYDVSSGIEDLQTGDKNTAAMRDFSSAVHAQRER